MAAKTMDELKDMLLETSKLKDDGYGELYSEVDHFIFLVFHNRFKEKKEKNSDFPYTPTGKMFQIVLDEKKEARDKQRKENMVVKILETPEDLEWYQCESCSEMSYTGPHKETLRSRTCYGCGHQWRNSTHCWEKLDKQPKNAKYILIKSIYICYQGQMKYF